MSGTMDKIKAKVDNVLHKDKTSDPTGPHDSHSANKADPRVDSDRIGAAGNTAGAGGVGAGQYGSSHTGTHTTGTHTGSHGVGHSDPTGPHDSHMANKADPRVDSDRFGAAGNTAGAGGVGAGQYGSTGTHTTGGLTGTHGTHTGTHGVGHSDPTGPHDSHMANKADPRVDSDRFGAAGNTAGAGGIGAGQYGSTGTHTTGGMTGTHGTHTGTHGVGHSDPTGPHNSHMANKADPRVDSDRYGAAGNTAGAGGVGAGQYGSTHTGTHTGTHGTHGGLGGNTVGSGNSNTTAGPHNSDMMNKIDPRVDSDLDGSKTVGGNKTYQ